MLMSGHNLYGHLDDSISAPTRTISQNNCNVDNFVFIPWYNQDHLIQNAILAFFYPTLSPIVAFAVSSKAAWDAKDTAYAKIS